MLGELDFFGGGVLEVGGWDFCLGSGVWVGEEGGVSVLGFIRVFFPEDAVVGVSLPQSSFHISCHPSPYKPNPPHPIPPHIPSFPLAFFSTSRHPPKHPTPPPPNPPVPPNSTIRQVPDNQEAYLSTTGLTSLLFDLAERVHPDPDTDAEALRFHLADIVAEGDESTVLESAEVRLGNFPYV